MAGPRGFARGHAQTLYVCNTPILNSRVAGAWLAASMPREIQVSVGSRRLISTQRQNRYSCLSNQRWEGGPQIAFQDGS